MTPFTARPVDPPTGRIDAISRGIIAPGIALLAAAQFALFGYFLFRTAIGSPISDMFAYIDVYLRFRGGEMPLLDYLWRAHGEHHLVWIRLLTWADVAIFHTRGTPFMAAATAAVAATALLVWRQLRTADARLGAATCLGLLAPMLILSAANVTDCSVPINTTYPLTVFFVVLSLVLFSGGREGNEGQNYRRGAAILAAFGASMGTGAGLLAWPILLWMAWRERLNRAWLAGLAGSGIAYGLFYMRGLYLLGLAPAARQSAMAFFDAAHIQKLSLYFFSFLGLPFSREATLEMAGVAAGGFLFSIGLAAVLIASFTDRLNDRLDRIAIGMILLALGAGALATVGRSDLIDEVKVPVRYAMFTTALHVGLLCIVLPRVVRSFKSPRARLLQCSGGLALAAVLLVLQVFIGRSAAQVASGIAREADCYAEGTLAGPVSRVVTKYPQDAEKVLAALRQEGLLARRSRNCAASPQG